MYEWIHSYKHTLFNDLYTANVLRQIEEKGLKPTILSGADLEIYMEDNYIEHFCNAQSIFRRFVLTDNNPLEFKKRTVCQH